MKSEGKHPHLLQRELIRLHDKSKSSQQITAKIHSKLQQKFTAKYSENSQQKLIVRQNHLIIIDLHTCCKIKKMSLLLPFCVDIFITFALQKNNCDALS